MIEDWVRPFEYGSCCIPNSKAYMIVVTLNSESFVVDMSCSYVYRCSAIATIFQAAQKLKRRLVRWNTELEVDGVQLNGR